MLRVLNGLLCIHYQMIHVTIMDTVVLIVFVETVIPFVCVCKGSLQGLKKNGKCLIQLVDA